jgi:hypothetical protein
MRPSDKAAHFRAIAQTVVDHAFPDGVPADEQAEIITSITRQLLTNDGHAGLMTARGQFWVKVVEKEDEKWEIGIGHVPEITVLRFMRQYDFDSEQVPEILHRLTVAQSAEFTNRQGVLYRFWVEPKERTTKIKKVTTPAE